MGDAVFLSNDRLWQLVMTAALEWSEAHYWLLRTHRLFYCQHHGTRGEYTERNVAKISTLDFPLLVAFVTFTIIHVNKNFIFSEVVFDIIVEIELYTLDLCMAFLSFNGAIQQTNRLVDTCFKEDFLQIIVFATSPFVTCNGIFVYVLISSVNINDITTVGDVESLSNGDVVLKLSLLSFVEEHSLHLPIMQLLVSEQENLATILWIFISRRHSGNNFLFIPFARKRAFSQILTFATFTIHTIIIVGTGELSYQLMNFYRQTTFRK